MNDSNDLKYLLERRGKLIAKLELVKEKFKEEKENEEGWPGHEGNFLVELEQEQQLYT